VSIVCSNSIYFPNAINTFGENPSFYPKGKGIRSVKYFRIYNRYGQLVFEKHDMQLNDASAGWDGTFKGIRQSSGTYVYMAEAQCDTGDLIPLQGTIVLF
jgi:gliding motility-associated-like protein